MGKTAQIAGVSASRVAAVAAVVLAALLNSGCSTSGLDAGPVSSTGFGEDALIADRDRALADMPASGEPGVDAIETGAIHSAATRHGPVDTSASGSAGVFGSVAIPIRNFPVSARWARVNREIEECALAMSCDSANDLLERIAAAIEGKPLAEKLGIVNAMVNTSIRYRSDASVYRKRDYWAGPRETLSRGSGDCEDFAILKMTALRRAGLPASRVSLVVLRDNDRGVFHAVVAVSGNSGRFILDNNNSRVAMDAGLPWYQPLYSLSGARAWIHGTRVAKGPALAQGNDLSLIAPGEGLGG
jgi:predicted transglutaminase-like cysteine proteinase